MVRLYITLICFIIPLLSFSQEEILLKGKINADSLQESTIHIINYTAQTGTVNSSSGNFHISVKENDVLWFTSVQYKKVEIQISPEIFKTGYLEVSLKEEINELAEVNISNHKLTGIISTDLSNINTVNKYDLGVPMSNKPPPTQEERRIYTATRSAGGILSVDYVINVLSGRLKKLKNEKEIADLKILVSKGIELLPLSFFVEEMGLKEEEIINFFYYCTEHPDYKKLLKGSNKLALIEFYQDQLVFYKKQIEE